MIYKFDCLLVSLVIILSSVSSLPIKPILELKNKCYNEKLCLINKPLEISPSPQELCELCYIGMPLVRELIKNNETKYFKGIATFVCTVLNITELDICNQAVGLFEDIVLNVINQTTLNDKELCSVGIGCEPVKNPILNWNISLPNVPKPPVKPLNPPSPSSPKLRILQISDLHIDFEYQPGSLATCDQPLCCRNSSTSKTNPKTKENEAGYWGDYRNCDVPYWAVESMFEHISTNEQFDFIYWTGDLPPHNVWSQTKQDQISALDKLTELFKKYFKNKAVFPTLGNHESSPVNIYPPPFVKNDNISWLYTRLAQDWTQTGLPDYLAPNISSGAFYTIQLYQGLRLVSLNMNYCPGENFYLYINSTDPLGQLAWLLNILQESENIGEKVHIIGHIHPDSCLNSFSENYYRIVNRYESTIVGQFFGHSHSDEFKVFYDLNNLTRAVGISYISGSVTTYSNLNPNYRIFTIDGPYQNSTFQVLDHETYIMNLTEANLSLKAVWNKEYSAKEAFNMTSVYPQDWHNLLDKMLKDLDGPLVDKLYKYNVKSADNQGPCDTNCRKCFICDFKQARSDNFVPC